MKNEQLLNEALTLLKELKKDVKDLKDQINKESQLSKINFEKKKAKFN